MQYAIMEVQGRKLLLDSSEAQAVDSYGHDGISDAPRPDEQAAPLVLCYGGYLPQVDIPSDRVRSDLLGAQGSWLGHISGPTCQLIAVQAVVAYEPEKVGRNSITPFAALIQAHESVLDALKDTARAVTAFVRYPNMSPADNLLNRHGVMSLRGIEKRIKSELTLLAWESSIDKSRAIRAAKSIK
jgi:hypothetical protein